MAEQTRTQRRYDHRLRHLVQESGDIRLAIRHGVPRSTARDWLRSPKRGVVTADLAERTEDALRSEVLVLRRRNAKLLAMLRLVIVLLRVFDVSLAGRRIADGSKKRMLLRAIDRSRQVLTLKVALRILKLSTERYHSWKREETCDLDDVPSCPRTSPQHLTNSEIRTVKEMVTSQDYRHVPTGTLSVLAQRLGKVFASSSTWYRLVRRYRWRRPRWRVHPEKPKLGIRAAQPNEIWHIDTTVIRLLDSTQVYLHAVIDNFSRRILSWKVSGSISFESSVSILLEASGQVESSPADDPPTLLADAGSENVNRGVDELIESGVLRRILARTEIACSNSMIESWWRVLKHQWLYLNSLDSLATVRRLVNFYVREHNVHLPHSAFRGQTPDEMYFGSGDHVPEMLKESRLAARQARLAENRARSCESCR